MRYLRVIGSGWMLALFMVISGVIVIAASLGNAEPLTGTVGLFRAIPLLSAPVLFLGICFLCRAFECLIIDRWRRFASILVNSSLGLLILISIYSVLFVRFEKIRLTEGDDVAENIMIESINLNLPEEVLVIGEDVGLKLKNVTAVLSSGEERVTVGTFPFSRVSGLSIAINEAGISPDCEIISRSNVERTGLFSLLPPGRRAKQFLLNGNRLLTELAPVRTFRKGRLEGKVFDLLDPLYHMTIETQGNRKVFDQALRDNRSIYTLGLSVSCRVSREWVELNIDQSLEPFMFYILLVVLFAGLVLYPVQFFVFLRFRDIQRP